MKTRNAAFKRIGTARVQRSAHDLSHTKIFDCDMGYLYPVLCEDVVPGDKFKIGAEMLLRFQPLVHPILHEINGYYHIFFVPYRLLDDNFEDFITMGVTGDYEGTLTSWYQVATGGTFPEAITQKGTLWDFIIGGAIGIQLPNEDVPNAFPKQAYNFIYNEFYRDQNYIEPVDLMQNFILKCAWEKDYFTSAQPEQQRGTSPSFPITGLGNIVYNNNSNYATRNMPQLFNQIIPYTYDELSPPQTQGTFPFNLRPFTNVAPNQTTRPQDWTQTNSYGNMGHNYGDENFTLTDQYQQMYADMSTTSLFNINDLRLATQLQMWMERNQRGGVRYTEFLHSHFHISPRDERLDRPEYIGGLKFPVVISEVLQTSGGMTGSITGESTGSFQNTSPQGNLAGHGIGANRQFAGRYLVREFGLIMGLLSIRPRTVYSQGIERMFLKKTPFDFLFPEFTHLSEQAIKGIEIYASSDHAKNTENWAFIPIYDHYRYRRNTIANNMRDYFAYWHMARQFTSFPELNKDFIEMTATKRVFAVQTEPGMVVSWGNIITAVRPLPVMGEPGRLDHS